MLSVFLGGLLKVKDFAVQKRKHAYGNRPWRQSRAGAGGHAGIAKQSQFRIVTKADPLSTVYDAEAGSNT
jgi:hypothetical protein